MPSLLEFLLFFAATVNCLQFQHVDDVLLGSTTTVSWTYNNTEPIPWILQLFLAEGCTRSSDGGSCTDIIDSISPPTPDFSMKWQPIMSGAPSSGWVFQGVWPNNTFMAASNQFAINAPIFSGASNPPPGPTESSPPLSSSEAPPLPSVSHGNPPPISSGTDVLPSLPLSLDPTSGGSPTAVPSLPSQQSSPSSPSSLSPAPSSSVLSSPAPSSPNTAASQSSQNTGNKRAIAGGVTGGVILILCIVVSLLFFRRRRNRQARELYRDPDLDHLPIPFTSDKVAAGGKNENRKMTERTIDPSPEIPHPPDSFNPEHSRTSQVPSDPVPSDTPQVEALRARIRLREMEREPAYYLPEYETLSRHGDSGNHLSEPVLPAGGGKT